MANWRELITAEERGGDYFRGFPRVPAVVGSSAPAQTQGGSLPCKGVCFRYQLYTDWMVGFFKGLEHKWVFSVGLALWEPERN